MHPGVFVFFFFPHIAMIKATEGRKGTICDNKVAGRNLKQLVTLGSQSENKERCITAAATQLPFLLMQTRIPDRK